MDNKENDLCNYRLNSALETMETANLCVENRHYKDAINQRQQNILLSRFKNI